MPSTTALSTPLRAWKCPQCTLRSISTTTPRQSVGPEHPRYIDVPTPPQQSTPDLPFRKGRLPVPRDVFRGAKGEDKATNEWVEQHTQAPKKEPQVTPGSRAEWVNKMSAMRRKNMREGLASLRARRTEEEKRQNVRNERRMAERKAALNAPIRADELLTAPSHGLDLIHPPDAPYNIRIREATPTASTLAARLAQKHSLVAARENERATTRASALQSLYTNARHFIVNSTQLDAAIEQEFGTADNPVMFGDTSESNEDRASVWAFGRPENVQDLLSRANRQPGKKAMDVVAWSHINADRIRRIGEKLTGGTIEKE